MGRDKLSIEVGGQTLIHRVHAALIGVCQEVLVVGHDTILLEGVRRAGGERPGGQGPLAGIEAGLAAARHPLAFIAAGDMPFLRENMVQYLLDRLETSGALAVVPRYQSRVHPLCAAYSPALLPRVRTALDSGTRAVHEFLEGIDEAAYVGEELRRFGDPDLLLMNINSPEDLERARSEAGR